MSRLPVPPSAELDAAVAAIQRGEASEAHEELLFKSLYRPLWNFFSQREPSRADVDDLTQVTLTRVFENIDDYRSDGALWAWVRRIAVNTLSNHRRDREALKRRASREVPLELPPTEDEHRPARQDKALLDEPQAETRVLEGEKRRLLLHALAALPAGMRKAVSLRIGGLQYNEIAETLGVGLNTVRSQLHTGKDRLRRILAEHFPELEGGEGR